MPWITNFKSLFLDDYGNILVGGIGIDPLLENNIAIVVKFDRNNGSIIDITAPFGYLYSDFINESGLGYIIHSSDGGYFCGGWTFNWLTLEKQYSFSKYIYDSDIIPDKNELNFSINRSNSNFHSNFYLSSSIISNNQNVLVSFIVNENSYINIEIFNILGQKVKNLINNELLAGEYNITWDSRDNMNNLLPSGSYFIRYQDNYHSCVKSLKIISTE